jgi:hypothetical protein
LINGKKEELCNAGEIFMGKIKKEEGMLIVEATVVFPVMFLVIFVLLFTGNAYMQKCRVESVIQDMAVKGASYCADPLLSTVEAGSVPTSSKDVEVEPYRYLIGGMDSKEEQIKTTLQSRLSNISTGLFDNMKPSVQINSVKYSGSILYSSFEVEVVYKIKIPIRLLGESENLALSVQTHDEVPVEDVPEFIRNVNMVEDYMDSTGVTDKITKMIDAVKEHFR